MVASIPFLLILLPLFLSYTCSLSSSLPSPSSPPKPSPSSPPSKPSPSSPPPKPSPSSPPSKPPPSSPPSKPSPFPSTLDPKQLTALQSLNIPTLKDPCTQPSLHNSTLCDSSKPFRHLIYLTVSNCSDDTQMSITALKSLYTLQDLQFINCPIPPVHFPSDLIANLHSFTCINSLRKLTGVWLGRLRNLTDLTVTGVPINASGLLIILGNLKNVRSVTISHTNLIGHLPEKWNLNISHIDLSGNKLRGSIPTSLTLLENLQFLNLSSNALLGELPTSLGDLLSLQNASFSSNSISGSIPDSISEIPGLVHLDLSSNQFNGTIPKPVAGMKSLKYLNLENNNFHGVMPFNGSFIKRLVVFKVGGNSNLCYNHSLISEKLKLGIAPCDKDGLPVLPKPGKSDSGYGDSSSSSSSSNTSDDTTDDDSKPGKVERKHGPSTVVLGVAIGLSSIVFLIVFLVLLSKWCA